MKCAILSHSPTRVIKQRKIGLFVSGTAVPQRTTSTTKKGGKTVTLKDEIKLAEDNGYKYIPPYKLAEMMKLSNKIVKLLTDNVSAVALSYDDMKTVMQIVNNALDQGIQRGDSLEH